MAWQEFAIGSAVAAMVVGLLDGLLRGHALLPSKRWDG